MPDLLESADAWRRDRELTTAIAVRGPYSPSPRPLSLKGRGGGIAPAPVLLFQHVSRSGTAPSSASIRSPWSCVPASPAWSVSNGSGKSTLLQLGGPGRFAPILGSVQIAGLDAWSRRRQTPPRRLLPRARYLLRRNVGAHVRANDGPAVAGYVRAPMLRRRTEETLELVGMKARADRKLAGYSKGMRQRIKLAQALLHDPELLLLDEPLSGIDPIGRRESIAAVPRIGGARQMSVDFQPRIGRAGKADRSRRHHGRRPHRRRRNLDADS